MRDLIKFLAAMVIGIVAIVAAIALPIVSANWLWGDKSVAEIENRAPQFLTSHGLEIIGREGVTYGLISQPGGCVWYTLRRANEPQTLYTACVSKWHSGQLELWNLEAVNAIRPGAGK